MLAASVRCPFRRAATDLEVTHWWTSGGEAAAVAELAKAFDATGNHWVDGAIAGGGSTARPIMISRITGGDPMAATQFNHGRQAEELVEAGLMRDLTDLATTRSGPTSSPRRAARELHARWQDLLRPGQHPLVAVALALQQGLRGRGRRGPDQLGRVRRRRAEAPRGRQGAARHGRPALAARRRLQRHDQRPRRQGPDDEGLRRQGRRGRRRAGDGEGLPGSRRCPRAQQGSNVQDWNQATNMVITDTAGGQIMGDWAQGEFQVAGEVAGKDYTCLPGLGVNELISTDGDAFYFPVLDDEEKSKAQEVLASTMFNPEVQVAFNLKKGSLPIRKDVDLGPPTTA